MFRSKVLISGKECWPIVEGGKGVGASDGTTAGSFAATGAIGTFSGVNAKMIGSNGEFIPLTYNKKNRQDRHEELVEYSIKSAVTQAERARDIAGGNGCIHMNVLWEMGGLQRIVHGVLSRTRGLIHGITCGAGMPYKLAEIASSYKVYYYPIVSSMRAFRALWKRSYKNFSEFLGGVVYEDPWVAGGHNGLSNSESPDAPQDPFSRVADIRTFMNEVGLNSIPLIMAGGVWYLREWQDWINNLDIGPVVFQFGTRPLLTKESPLSDEWKSLLKKVKPGDVTLNKYSPTGFYSSAIDNEFIQELRERSLRQVEFYVNPIGEYIREFAFGARGRVCYVSPSDRAKIDGWIKDGFDVPMKTPDDTLIFVTAEKAVQIRKDQVGCMGCLSHCRFSNWKDHDDHTTGKKPDPRTFCIQDTLQKVIWGGNVQKELVFAGHNAHYFSTDPFYANENIPTIKELVDRILTGN